MAPNGWRRNASETGSPSLFTSHALVGDEGDASPPRFRRARRPTRRADTPRSDTSTLTSFSPWRSAWVTSWGWILTWCYLEVRVESALPPNLNPVHVDATGRVATHLHHGPVRPERNRHRLPVRNHGILPHPVTGPDQLGSDRILAGSRTKAKCARSSTSASASRRNSTRFEPASSVMGANMR